MFDGHISNFHPKGAPCPRASLIVRSIGLYPKAYRDIVHSNLNFINGVTVNGGSARIGNCIQQILTKPSNFFRHRISHRIKA